MNNCFNKVITSVLLMILFSSNLRAQYSCGTDATPLQQIDTKYLPQSERSLTDENLCLRVFYHIVRKSDGTGGVSSSEVYTSLGRLDCDFNPNNIYFIWDGTIDYIDDNQKYYNMSPDIFSVNGHSNGIDIYLYPFDISYCYNDRTSYGKADGIGSGSAFFIGGNYFYYPFFHEYIASSSYVSHEMGHVLNLYHTHHGTYHEPGGELNQCAEFVDGSNSDTCGDCVEDTPADPNMDFHVDFSTCTWQDYGSTDAHGDFYNPNTELIMSYSEPSCMQYFTPKQVLRMKTAIHGLSVLRNASISISGSSYLFGTNTYSVSNLPSGYSVSWTFTPNGITPSGFSFQANSPQTGQCTTSYTNRPQDFSGTLYAAIYNGTLLVTTLSKELSYVFPHSLIGTYSQVDGFNSNHIWDIPTTSFYDEDEIFCNIKSTITLNSPLFACYNTTYSGANLTNWYDNGNGTITLKFGYSANSQQHLTVTGRDYNTNNLIYQFYLTALPANGGLILNHLNVNVVGETLNIYLENMDDNDRLIQNVSDDITDNNEQLYITITNSLTGQTMFRSCLQEVKTEVSTSGWPKGVYIVKGEMGNNSVVRKISIR